MSKSPMTTKAAGRIQSHADRTGTNQGFKARAQAAAAPAPARSATAPSGGKIAATPAGSRR